MSRSDWVLGDDKGNKYVEVPSLFPKNVVKHLDYVVYGDVKFVSERKVHDERVRELEFTTCKCGEEIERPASICPSCGRMVVE